MSQRRNFQLPKCDGATSTNYGPDFEILAAALFILKLCQNSKTFRIWINKIDLSPWDDIVAEVDDKIICVQLKHNEKLDKVKLNSCLNERENVRKKLVGKNVIFVYFTTSPSDDGFRSNFTQVSQVPDLLSLLVTNVQKIYSDKDTSNGHTICCMQQHNIVQLKLDLKQSLEEFIGNHLLTKGHLGLIQTKFLEYLKLRYQKLTKEDDPSIRNEEITTQLSYCILDKFKVEYKGSDSKIVTTNNLDTVLDLSSIVVVNHKPKSSFKEQIWQHLTTALREAIAKRHLKQNKFDSLWMEGKLHMPIVSSCVHSDKIILRALQIGNYKPKVLILREKIFSIKEKQHVITILQNLNKSPNEFETETGDSLEKFAYAQVSLQFLLDNNKLILHKEAFVKVAKNFFNSPERVLEQIVEAHDEFNFVNNKDSHALFAAIRVKDVDLSVVQHIVDLGSDVNAVTEDDNTPIFYAIEENRLDILNLLLKNGADPNPSNKFGVKPLFIAVSNNRLEMMESLIEFGARRFDCDRYGVSPLFMAYRAKHYDAMKLILRNFDRANAADVQGSHILHRAAEDNEIECLKIVADNCLCVGAFINGDRMGKTPLEIAQERRHLQFWELLKAALKD